MIYSSRTRKKYCIVLMVILFTSVTSAIQAIDVQQAKVTEKVVISTAWGSGKGEIGEVPGRLDSTPAESINPIAVDSKGNIYVGDSVNYRVQKYGSSGNFLSEFNLKNFDEWPYKNIPDIFIDGNDNIYVVLLRKRQIAKFSPDGTLISTYDLSKVGVLKKNINGIVQLNAKDSFGIIRVRVDRIGNIYALGNEGNVLKLNSKGEIIQRWGPHASNASHFLFTDDLNNLYLWLPPQQDGSMFKRYDVSGKFLGTGLGIYDQIIEPFYSDSKGNVYGFTIFTDNALAVYNYKNQKLFKLPIKKEGLTFERWTVDLNGNIYHSREGGQFEIRKLSVLVGK